MAKPEKGPHPDWGNHSPTPLSAPESGLPKDTGGTESIGSASAFVGGGAMKASRYVQGKEESLGDGAYPTGGERTPPRHDRTLNPD